MKGLFWFLDFPPTPPAAKILPILSLLLSPKEAEGDMGGVSVCRGDALATAARLHGRAGRGRRLEVTQ